MDGQIIWNYKKLDEFARVVKGCTPPRDNPLYYSENGMPWVKMENLTYRVVTDSGEYLSPEGVEYGKTVPEGSVLLSINRTIGKVGIAGAPLQTNEQIAAIVCNDGQEILPEYLYYYLLFAEKQLQEKAYVTVGSRLGLELLRESIIPIAPMERQTKWVRALMQVEDFLWGKEEILRLVRRGRDGVFPEESLARGSLQAMVRQLEATLEEMLRVGDRFLRAILTELFAQADSVKERCYYSGERNEAEKDPLDGLDGVMAGIIRRMSAFQQELYLQFMREREPQAIHEILKRVKQQKPEFAAYHIQDATASVEMFRQLGLMKQPVRTKLYYDEQKSEDNVVRGEDGRPLSIELWSCTEAGRKR